MSLPGNRGTDDFVLIGVIATGTVVLFLAGIWAMMNAPRSDPPVAAAHDRPSAVRILDVTVRDGTAQIQYEDGGVRHEVFLPEGDPRVAKIRKVPSGTEITVPEGGMR